MVVLEVDDYMEITCRTKIMLSFPKNRKLVGSDKVQPYESSELKSLA